MAETSVFIGSYTTDLGWVQGKGQGITAYKLDLLSGVLSQTSSINTDNPSFLALHPSGHVLYANNEASHEPDASDDSVSAFEIKGGGSLALLNQRPSHGASPCFVSVDPQAEFAFLANFNGGNFVVYPLGKDGSLESSSDKASHQSSLANQLTPHAHSITPSPSGRYLLACDLGLDKLFIYRLDRQQGKLVSHDEFAVAKGSGPRHVSFHPNARFVYLINQDAGQILVFEWDDVLGTLTERQIVATVPDDFSGDPAASEIQVHPSGAFLYASNRGHNNIVIYRIDQSSGLLNQIGDQPSLGLTPRNFALTPCGSLLLVGNQDSDQVVVFRIDPVSGLLHELNSQAVPTPVCIVCGG